MIDAFAARTCGRWLRRLLPALIGVLALVSIGEATDKWTTPFDGVKLLHRTTASPKWNIYVLVVDTTIAGIQLDATATGQRKQKPSSYAKAVKAQAAINGDFFLYSTYATTGLAGGDGKAWTDTADNKADANLSFSKGSPPKPILHPSADILKFDAKTMWGVVSGHPIILSAGAITAAATKPTFCTARHPRTMIGLDQGGTKLFMAVVDGRQPSLSVGMRCDEEATLLKGLGAWNALNLDGGGSTAMYVAGQGVVNSPSDGTERTVGNHLALFAAPSGTVGSFTGKVYEKGNAAKLLSGATVQITGGPADLTDAKGVYQLSVAPGTWTLTVTMSGYATQTIKKTIAKKQTLTVDFALVPSLLPTDIDGDGVVDLKDNCPKIKNPGQEDFDKDGLGNVCDGDDDNDLVFDEDDNCPLVANTDQLDTDKDLLGDACDPDDDNDGVLDAADNCALLANADQADKDGDGIGDVCDPVDNSPPAPDTDLDGWADNVDNCPIKYNLDQADLDGDKQGDACDPDDDNDGEGDLTDNCPVVYNPAQFDKDGDGIGDACDPIDNSTPPVPDVVADVGSDAGPDSVDAGGVVDVWSVDVAAEIAPPAVDSDGDGWIDGVDNCIDVFNPTQADNDQDNLGDLCDPDDDNDVVEDAQDNCPNLYNPYQDDSDGDGLGDLCDPTPDPAPDTGADAGGDAAVAGDDVAAQSEDAGTQAPDVAAAEDAAASGDAGVPPPGADVAPVDAAGPAKDAASGPADAAAEETSPWPIGPLGPKDSSGVYTVGVSSRPSPEGCTAQRTSRTWPGIGVALVALLMVLARRRRRLG